MTLTCLFFRAQVTNTQLGLEEFSGFYSIKVSGDMPEEVGPSIVVPPEDTQVTKGTPMIQLPCISNAK